MAFANEYRQYDPNLQPGFIHGAANPSEQGAYLMSNAAATQAAYNANQRRLAEQQAFNAQQQSAGQSTYANRVELEKELAYNEMEIRALQNELQNMRAQWGDLDSMDRQLAANRARVGDFGNARAHQNDIIARQNDRNRVADTAMQWRWQASQNRISREADQQKQAKADIKRLIGEIEDVGVQIPYQTDPGAKNQLEAKKARLISELAAYGVTYDDPNPAGGSNFATTLPNQEASYKDKNGLFNSPDEREKIAKAYEELGLLAEAKRVRETHTVQEKQNKKAEWEKGRKEAVSLIEKHRAKTESEIASLTNKVNAKTDPEIKKILKYATYDQKTGQFRMKE